MLSFQIKQMGNHDGIEIFLDDAGMAILSQRILDAKESGHVHLYGFKTLINADIDQKTPYEQEGVLEIILNWCGD